MVKKVEGPCPPSLKSGGATGPPCSAAYGCARTRLPRKSDFLYTNFLPNFPPISIPFLKEKHPILTKLDAFYKFSQNRGPTQSIYVIWAPSLKPPDRYTKFREKAPQKVGTYTYTMSMWEPPPPGVGTENTEKVCLLRFHTWLSITQQQACHLPPELIVS